MKKKIHFSQAAFFAALILILSLTWCKSSSNVQTKETESTENTSKTGVLSFQYFYEEDGIALASREHFMYSDWEPVEFDYICTDPTCSHLLGSCSARTISNTGEKQDDFCMVYQNHLVIVHAYSELEAGEESETALEFKNIFYTDVYEADLDGNNRTKKMTFSGAIAETNISYAAVLVDGKLYFGGPMETRSIQEMDEENPSEVIYREFLNDAVYCLDLKDYTLETFNVRQDEEYHNAYQYQFYEFDGAVYAILSDFGDDRAIWYRIWPKTGECEEIFRCESKAARFCGAIGDTVYYTYENSGKTLYARDIAKDAEEREIMTESAEDVQVSAFVLDGKILFQTDRVYEGENRMSEYAVLDRDGTILDTIHYDEFITFHDVVGDRLIYFTIFSDREERWADKADLGNLLEQGIGIGPFIGEKQDMSTSNH